MRVAHFSVIFVILHKCHISDSTLCHLNNFMCVHFSNLIGLYYLEVLKCFLSAWFRTKTEMCISFRFITLLVLHKPDWKVFRFYWLFEIILRNSLKFCHRFCYIKNLIFIVCIFIILHHNLDLEKHLRDNCYLHPGCEKYYEFGDLNTQKLSIDYWYLISCY